MLSIIFIKIICSEPVLIKRGNVGYTKYQRGFKGEFMGGHTIRKLVIYCDICARHKTLLKFGFINISSLYQNRLRKTNFDKDNA